MEAYYNDARSGIIVVLADGEAEEFTIEEFVAYYGEEALPITPEEAAFAKKIDSYYCSGEEMCAAIGSFASAVKLKANADEGVFPCQEVIYNYYGKQGDANTHLDQEIESRGHKSIRAIHAFDRLSQEVGFKPMSDQDVERLFKLLYDEPFRRRFLEQLRRHHKKGDLVSARDITIHVFKLIKKAQKIRAKASNQPS